MLRRIIRRKLIKEGVKVIKKIDEKTNASKTIKKHAFEIIIYSLSFSGGLYVGNALANKYRKKTIWEKITEQKNKFKRRQRRKLLLKAIKYLNKAEQ